MDSDFIATEIFVGIARVKKLQLTFVDFEPSLNFDTSLSYDNVTRKLHKRFVSDNSLGGMFNNDTKKRYILMKSFKYGVYLDEPKFTNIRELSFFKNNLIRKIICFLCDDLFWEEYERSSIYYSKFIAPKTMKDAVQFNEGINVLTPGDSLEEKSILLRVIFILMGVNPYKHLTKDNLEVIYKRVSFEIDKLLAAFRLLKQLESYEGPLPGYKITDSWGINKIKHIELLEEARELVDCVFLIWSYSVGGITIHAEDSEVITGIMEEQLVKIWGGSIKAFKNELNRRIKDQKVIIKYIYLDSGNFGPNDTLPIGMVRETKIGIVSAIEWLDKKRINTTFLDQSKDSDFNYQDFHNLILTPSRLNIKSVKSNAKKYLDSIKKD